MTLIPELERELSAMAARRTRGRKRRWLFAGVPVALAVTGTAALAATGVIPIGSPVSAPGDQYRKPDRGTGVIVPGTDRLLDLSTPDPDGEPPWGMRIVSTTRGLGCMQVGRLVDGRIGVLGRDGAFANDGRFHPFADSTVGNICASLDGAGRLFANSMRTLVPASASLRGECWPRAAVRGVPERSFCDDRSLRNLHFGTLGPEAVAITVDGRRIPLAAPEGAYLLVRRPPASMRSSVQGGGTPWPDNRPITAIHYRDGSACEVTVHGPERPCKMPGYVAPARPDVTPRDIPVSVRLRQGRSGRWTATVRFTAPVAVTDASSHYEIRLTPPPRKTRGWSHMILPTDRNIAQGENVSERFTSLRDKGRYRGVVTFEHAGEPGGTRIGRFSFRLR